MSEERLERLFGKETETQTAVAVAGGQDRHHYMISYEINSCTKLPRFVGNLVDYQTEDELTPKDYDHLIGYIAKVTADRVLSEIDPSWVTIISIHKWPK